MKNAYAGLYIHVPFCLSKCGYCSFYSVSGTQLIAEFIKVVSSEMSFYKQCFPSFDTMYLGGGTPSLLSVEQIELILQAAQNHFDIARHAEITMEVNPGDASVDYFRTLRRWGVNRLNIGIQSFDDRLLKFLGRRHTAAEALKSIESARHAGFDNIGIDLIYGVHGQDFNTWRHTLAKALSLGPEHLSCYQLSLSENTPLHKHYAHQGICLPMENEALNFFMKTSQILTDAGYSHYEVSNYARADIFRSAHNMKYWRHLPYLGLGPSAHSFLDRHRWWNQSSVHSYLNSVSGGIKPMENSEALTLEQLRLETLFLSMRTKDGVDLRQYENNYGTDLLSEKKAIIDKLIMNQLVILEDNCLRPTLSGMAVADSLALI
ncbi:MAG: radical SAM family heme chaperone HemW [Smithellaceae bacterium]